MIAEIKLKKKFYFENLFISHPLLLFEGGLLLGIFGMKIQDIFNNFFFAFFAYVSNVIVIFLGAYENIIF